MGKFTPELARAFAEVEACDLSERAIRHTRAQCDAFANVHFHCLDLASDRMPFAPVAFVLCVNVLLMPSLDERRRAWRCVVNQVDHGGCLVLVVPSLESVQMERYHAIESRLDEGVGCAEAIRESMPSNAIAADLFQGVHVLDGVPTKHYLREELETELAAHEFSAIQVEKLRYRTPGEADPLPHWDWMAVAQRR